MCELNTRILKKWVTSVVGEQRYDVIVINLRHGHAKSKRMRVASEQVLSMLAVALRAGGHHRLLTDVPATRKASEKHRKLKK